MACQLGGLLNGAGVLPIAQQGACLVTGVPSLLQPHLGVDAKRQAFLLVG